MKKGSFLLLLFWFYNLAFSQAHETNELDGEKFPDKYEIPFVIGKLENWKAVEYKHWKDAAYDYIETNTVQI